MMQHRHKSSIHQEYSKPMKLAFWSIKTYVMFLLGFIVAITFSSSLQLQVVVEILLVLLSQCIVPLTVIIFCLVMVTIVLESMK